MKKILILILFLFFAMPCFAEYKPIPKELSRQYKKEMEKIIEKGYPKAIDSINEYFNHVEDGYKKLKNKYDEQLYWSYIPEVSIRDMDMFVYAKLMKVTQEKYLRVKYEPIGVDFTVPVAEFLHPYFKDNNVNTTKLMQLSKYSEQKEKIIEKYSKEINKLYKNRF